MSVRRTRDERVLERLTVKSQEVLRVRAFGLRDEISSTLERAAVGKGLVYDRASGNGEYRASAPGDPPARDTGRLINSIQANRQTDDLYEIGPAEASYRGDTPEYPVYLEFGTARMAPRPFMRPSIASFKQGIR